MATPFNKRLLWCCAITVALCSQWMPAVLSQNQASASPKSGFLYQPSVGSFWDPTVIFANGKYYMYTMYGGDGVWLATSEDGVHWKDYGVVLKSTGFKNNRVWKQYCNGSHYFRSRFSR